MERLERMSFETGRLLTGRALFLLLLSSRVLSLRLVRGRGQRCTSGYISRGEREEIERNAHPLIYLSFLCVPSSMISYLPTRSQVDKIIEFYLVELEITDHCFHRPSLLSSINSFFTTDPSNKGNDTTELSFLSLIFALLLGSACMLSKDKWSELGVSNESLEEFDEILEKWNLAYLTLLAASDWVQSPNIYAIQSVIVVRRFYWKRSRYASTSG